MNWASGVDLATGRPIENPAARYEVTGSAVAVQPSSAGAHNWHPMAFSPQTGLVYLSASDNALVYAPDRNFNPNPRVSNLGIDLARARRSAPDGSPACRAARTWSRGIPSRSAKGGASTVRPRACSRRPAGSCSAATTELVAYAAADGRELWSSQDVHTGIVAGPISFELDGVQHVAVVAGRATGNYYAPDYSRLLVFRRGANAQLPPAVEFTPPPLSPPASVATAERDRARPRALRGELRAVPRRLGNAGGLFRRGLFPDLALLAGAREPRGVRGDRARRRARRERHGRTRACSMPTEPRPCAPMSWTGERALRPRAPPAADARA